MPAIITDNLRIQNCTNTIDDISANGNYYTFIGLSNYQEIRTDWNSNTPDPIDNFNHLNEYKNTVLGVKKLTSSNVIRVIPKIVWQSGLKYDMYRHDYSANNLTPITNYTTLYSSRYYVMNSEYKVYICINNGASPSNNNKGVVSVNEPLHTDILLESDGYTWKYLYTISPADVLKFDSTNYISVPNNWETSTNTEIARIRDSAVDGAIQTILIESATEYSTSQTIINNVDILGDGTGGKATVEFDEQLRPSKVTVTSSGSGYTFATLDLDSIVAPKFSKSIFNVIIPPPGGHGGNIYKELGCNKLLAYTRIENIIGNPDFIEGNQFARVGIFRNLKAFGGTTNFTDTTGSGVYAIKLLGDASAGFTEDSKIIQASTGAVGSIVSVTYINSTTFVVKYTKPKEFYTDTYTSGTTTSSDPYFVGTSFSNYTEPSNGYNYANFDGSSVVITDGVTSSTYSVDTSFFGINVGNIYFGQTFVGGLSNPDINTKSGDIVYVDNRVSVTRQSQQREDIKIIIEF
jgi:hypothetical protein